MNDFEIVVIGGGLVGLACAEALTLAGHSLLVLERHERTGQETSSRNSGVVHAGIYYPPGSLKAKLCFRGRHLLEQRGRHSSVTLRRLGKLIVAADASELPALAALARNASACGVPLEPLDARQVAALEPQVRVAGGLFSPDSGIVDVDALLASYRQSATAHGATIALGTTVRTLEHGPTGWELTTLGRDGSEARVRTRWVVNTAGLDADDVARMAGVDVDGLGLTQLPCKGSYFMLAPRIARSVSRLVYPLPHGGGLGIHLTFDLAGGLRAGPDAEYVVTRDLAVDETKRVPFAAAIARYLPGIRPDDLTPAFAGIRPKLAGPGEAFRDFVIRHEAEVGLPGLINLLGIESPGLTASPAIAEFVSDLIREAG